MGALARSGSLAAGPGAGAGAVDTGVELDASVCVAAGGDAIPSRAARRSARRALFASASLASPVAASPAAGLAVALAKGGFAVDIVGAGAGMGAGAGAGAGAGVAAAAAAFAARSARLALRFDLPASMTVAGSREGNAALENQHTDGGASRRASARASK